jgi:predicted transglutaminase-like cysteine proteinase
MNHNSILGIAALVLGGCMAFATSAAATDLLPLATMMPDSQVPAPLPPGALSFCMRFPDECAVDENTGPAQATLTPALWNELQSVNNQVNRELTPIEDRKHYGVAEYWTIPTDGMGDCEDYTLVKRKALIAKGVPARALRMAIVRTAKDEQHAVLTVVTDRGDFVLDNLARTIKGWDDTGYRWIARHHPNSHQSWVALSHG